jgi:hypothetical protein
MAVTWQAWGYAGKVLQERRSYTATYRRCYSQLRMSTGCCITYDYLAFALLERLTKHSNVLDTVYSVWSFVRSVGVLLAQRPMVSKRRPMVSDGKKRTEGLTYSMFVSVL